MPKSTSRGRRILATLAATVVAATGVGCAPSAGSLAAEPDDDRPIALATFTVIADLAAAVAGDAVRVESLTRPGTPIHDYEPTPSDLVAAEAADLVIVNGLGVDDWIAGRLAEADAPRLVLGDVVEPIPIRSGHYRGAVNPHAWMSPRDGARYVEAVREALIALAPEAADAIAARAADMTHRLGELESELRDGVAALPPEHRLLVTCEAAFSYLARDAGLEEASLWPVNAGGQGTPLEIAAVADAVAARALPTVFCESTANAGTMEQIAGRTGATLDPSLYVDSLSDADGPAPTYLALLEHDIERILEGLDS